MSVTRRQFAPYAASAAALVATGPAFGQTTNEIVKWRLTSSFPKSLDTLFGAALTISRIVGEMTDGKFTLTPFGAGEIGHTWVPDPDTGKPDKLEHVASGWSIGKRGSRKIGRELSGAEGAALAQHGGVVRHRLRAATDTIGAGGGLAPREPRKGLVEKSKMPPSAPTMR